MKRIAALALIAGVAGASFAAGTPESVGYLSVAKGTISVGGQGFATKAAHGMRLVDGNTVMVPTNGRASVVLNNGCTVDLTGSQHFTVNSALPCAQLQASVSQMFDTHRVAQAGVSGGLGAGGAAGAAGLGVGLGVAAGIIAIGAIDVNNTEDDNVVSAR